MILSVLAATLAVPLFAARDISGTAWAPDETLQYGVHRRVADWDVMLHGVAFGQFIYEPPDFVHRTGGFSARQASSVNWGMLMARRRAGAGRVGIDVMLSLEPWTVPGCGTLDFFQNGETCGGDTIHDRQHPHDLFMELAASYDRPLTSGWRWQIYGGPAGEPALGPPAFPHRASAMDNPIAPIAHHWLDSTHIAFGVLTGALFSENWKIEASAFNGREPDEQRADLDLAPLDSYAGRVTWMPTPRLAIQASAGHLTDAEQQFAPLPRTSNDRATASVLYQRALGADGLWASTLAFGRNGGHVITSDGSDTFVYSNALLAETSLTLRGRHTWFGRAEFVGKPGHDLHVDNEPTTALPVTKVQAGYVREMAWSRLSFGIGGSASLSVVPSALVARYYGNVAKGLNLFVVIRPPRHRM